MNPSKTLRLATALSSMLTGGVFYARSAEAQITIKLPFGSGSKSTYDKLKAINDRVNATRKVLLQQVGNDLPAEKAKLDQATQEAKQERADLTNDLRSETKAFDSVNDNLTDVESWLASSKLAWESESALHAVWDGKTLNGAALPDADTKVKAFSDGARKEWKGAAEGATKRLAKLHTDVTEEPQRRAQAEAKAEAKAKSDATRAQKEQVADAGRAANQALQANYKTLSKGDVPDEASLAALEARSDEVEKLEAGTGRFYRTQAGLMRIAAALDQPDAADRLKALLEGEVDSHGDAKGKSYSVPVKAKKDHCYVLLGRFISWGGQEKLTDPQLVSPREGLPVQEFGIRWYNESNNEAPWLSMYGHGFCTSHDLTATFKGNLQVAGTRNGLRYVVMDFERAKFSPLLASHLELNMPDHCDSDAWAQMFLNAVPGTVAYLNAEPVLVTRVDDVGGNTDASIVFPNPGGDWSTTRKSALTSEPPKAVRILHPFTWKDCPGKDNNDQMPRGAASRAIVECGDRITAKYGNEWKQVEAMRRAADNVSSSQVQYYSPEAEARAGKLMDLYDQEFAKKCQPLVDKTKKSIEDKFNKLVDQLTDTPPQDPLRRADHAAEEETAPYRRW